jgi:hypothetical protein
VIRDTADAFWENSILFCDATHVWPETFPEIWNQDRSALFCAKDAMNVQTRESVRYELRETLMRGTPTPLLTRKNTQSVSASS